MIDMTQWRELDEPGAVAVAASVAERVGADTVEVRVQPGTVGRAAFFTVGGERFALVPGGEVTVGYDGARFAPTPPQAASFAQSADEWGLPDDIRAFVDGMTSPARTAVVPPLLVAVRAVEAGAVPVDVDHPVVTRLLDAHRRTVPAPTGAPPRRITWAGEGRVTLDVAGRVTHAWLIDVPTWQAEVDRLAAIGQRLPTPDEWEHACGAGASTLFRWGDACPDADDPCSATGPHREPNAFGLEIGQDPYRPERTADPGVVCGGDGGGMICGGVGWFVSWLTVATAYRDRQLADLLGEEENDEMYARPVIPLD